MGHLFTVITPAYEAEKYIVKAMQSVVDQTEKDFEYIVVENGSTDSTQKYIQQFIEEHPEYDIKMIKLDVNQGISGGRNAGIKAASGRYICLLDADDYWYPEKLSVVKKSIEEHPEYSVIGHWEDQVRDEQLVNVGKFRTIDNANAFRDLLFHGNCLSPSAVILETEILQRNGGFDETLTQGQEDFDCWLRLAHDGAKFYMIPEALSVWLIRNDSLSAKRGNHTEAVVGMLEKYFDMLAEMSEDKENVRKHQNWIYAMNYCGCARTMSLNGDRSEAYRMYKKSLSYCSTYWKAYAGIILNVLHL